MKHTPGPWTVLPGVPSDRDPWILHDGCKVATVDTSCPDPGELEANARLIAAAPDLYEAVMAFLTCLPADMSQWRSLGMDTTALTMARIKGCAAMAKAGWPDDEPPVENPDEAYCDRCNAYLGTGSNPGELCANCTAYDDELSRGEA